MCHIYAQVNCIMKDFKTYAETTRSTTFPVATGADAVRAARCCSYRHVASLVHVSDFATALLHRCSSTSSRPTRPTAVPAST